jgi:hypothetical protein
MLITLIYFATVNRRRYVYRKGFIGRGVLLDYEHTFRAYLRGVSIISGAVPAICIAVVVARCNGILA